MFFHIYRCYIKRGLDRGLYMERLTMQFGKVPRKELESYDKIITDQEFRRKRTKALHKDWYREKLQMKQFSEDKILSQVELITKEIEQQIARQKTVYHLLIVSLILIE
jgi:hypothetical protein